MNQPAVGGSPSVKFTVLETSLGPKTQINHGANGRIHRLQSFQLPDAPGPLVYKEYLGEARKVSLQGLIGILNARLQLPPHRRAEFDSMTVWPLRVVIDAQNRPSGVLMRLIPDEFMTTMTLRSGRTKKIPREIQHLIFDPQTARERNVEVPADNDLRTRLRIAERFATIIGNLHTCNLVFGDISARNVLYRLGAKPLVLLVDCDAARVRGSGAVNKQQDSPDWDPPENQRARSRGAPANQSERTDCYKVALFVLRCLTPGRGSSTNRDWQAASRFLDNKGKELMTLGLGTDPAARPRVREWTLYLRARLGEGPMPPMRGAKSASTPRRPSPLPTQPPPRSAGWKRGADGKWVPA